MNDIIYTTDREGTLLSINQAVQRTFRFDPQEVIGTHYDRWMPKKEFDKLEMARSDTLKGQRTTHQIVISDKEENEHHVEISVSPLVVDGRIEGTQGIIRDITKQRKAEQAVRESAEKLRSLFDATTESILLLDRQGTVLTLNETAARRFGKSPGVLIGTKIADVGEDQFPSSAVEYRTRRISEVLRTKQPVRFEDERAGRCFFTSAYPVFDEKGDVRQIAVFGQDITERGRAEEEIRSLQRQTEFILRAAKTSLNITDKHCNLRFVDSNWRNSHGDYQGRKCYEYYRGRDHPCPECGIPKALAMRQAVVHDGVVLREGDPPTEVTTIPFQAEDGEWLVAEVCVDITERKRLERQLRESEERYRTVVENAGEAISIVDVQGAFLFMNTTAARALAGHPSDFVGKTMQDLFPKEIADRQMQTVRRVIQARQGENVIVRSSVQGQLRWYNTTVKPLKDSAGGTTSVLVIARDIHDLQTARPELDTYREKMIRAEHLASLGTLSAMLSHEMTQPLMVIRLSIQNAMKTLEGTSCEPTVREDLSDGLAEIASVTAMIRRFHDFAGKMSDGTTGEVALLAVARRVIRLLDDSARKARIALDVDLPDDLPAIHAYGKEVEQIFFILAQNAVQAADGLRDHRFRIHGARRAGAVELQFADDCGGIVPKVLEHLFEPFLTTKPPGEGTGLGLCVVQRLVSQVGGHLKVDSRWGEGTTFFLTLPIETK